MSSRSFVMFLTRPLAVHYPISTIITAQQVLLANLSSIPLPTTLKLSASAPELPAFKDTGIPWCQWTSSFGNQELFFTLAENSVSVAFGPGEDSPAIVIWSRDVDQSSYVPCISKMKRSTVPHRTRSISSARLCTVKVPTLSTACIDEHSESDSDSDISNFSFSASSDGSLTSVSSRSPSPASDSPKYIPPGKVQKSSPTTTSSPLSPRYLSRKYPTTDNQNKKDVTKYLYRGGSTNVMTGGVMLGQSPMATKSAPRPRRKSVLLGPESNDWRRKN